MIESKNQGVDFRKRLQACVDHLDHVLPGQAPLLNFVHHNTLHGYQHLPFRQALEAAEKLTGIHGYLDEKAFRKLYAQGRIDEDDLTAAFELSYPEHNSQAFRIGDTSTGLRSIYRIALLYGIDSMEPSAFNWQVEELDALRRFQADVPQAQRDKIRQTAQSETAAVHGLWQACLSVFGLEDYPLHPEDLTEIPLRQADSLLAEFDREAGCLLACPVNPGVHHQSRADAQLELSTLLSKIGNGMSLRGVLLSLTGKDLLDEIRPVLVRWCAAYLDEGLASWPLPERSKGFYAAWKHNVGHDPSLSLADLPAWRTALAEMPDHAMDAVIMLLGHLEIPEFRWEGYLRRLALELPGWSGIINWRLHHPEYGANRENPASLTDYLAVRLFLDRLWIESLCQETWGITGKLSSLKAYFTRNTSELLARKMLYAGELPEYLANATQRLVGLAWVERTHHHNWSNLAGMIWTWRHSQAAEKSAVHTLYRSAWRLFRLSQHLGLAAADVRACPLAEAERLLQLLDRLTPGEKGHLWLLAYENHYRENLFAALAQNHGRGRWAQRESRPQAQLIFCMDDREESFRRHLEEANPELETLGVAGFFGIPMNWRGLDDRQATPLCPVVVTPAHEVREEVRPGHERLHALRQRRRASLDWTNRLLNQEIRRNLASSSLLVDLLAPGALASLLAKLFSPRQFEAWKAMLRSLWVPEVPKRLVLTAPPDSPEASPERPRLGFTDAEQAARVASLLRNIGLTSGFAPLVAVLGHGSNSQNNPHLAAYDCGACSGRHGGPNARVFASMANRPEVRELLARQGISIPEDTWFLGAEHNTCDDGIVWYDLEDLPATFRPALERLCADLDRAARLSAHERCRRFASAPSRPKPKQALRHVAGRAADFSQPRPELGHANNAAAFVGRRSATRGAFFDRRLFLISYDPTGDADGTVLEGILLAAGPVGAGINLEYYFSTVDNERYGCGSKVAHNVTGLIGIMEGTQSDLRTGLPKQMTEIHEPMRLNLVCEATEATLTAIYRRQQALRELIGNGWLLLSAIHPETGAISSFDPQGGFIPWRGKPAKLPVVSRSTDWYDGRHEALACALTLHPDHAAAAEPDHHAD